RFSAGMIASDILAPILPLIPVPRRAEATRGPRAPAPRKCFTASPRAARPRWFRILEWLDARRIFTTVCESKRPKSRHRTSQMCYRLASCRATPLVSNTRMARCAENIHDGLRIETAEIEKKKECNTRTSQEVTHPSTTLAQARLTSEF